MAIIDIRQVTFSYPSHYENIFESVSFTLDTDWKLGLIGRNGKGKTTLLRLLKGDYSYKGSIVSSVSFDYFPFELPRGVTKDVIKDIIAPYTMWEEEMARCIEEGSEQSLLRYGEILESYMQHDGYTIDELVEKELSKLGVDLEVLKQPIDTLSKGECTKLMLAALFLKKNNFLLIDEPTNHLDIEGRQVVAEYLKSQKGFILVSHDRLFLDQIIDHVISINRQSIEVQKGNYTSWKLNKDRQDEYEMMQNQKIKKEVGRLGETLRQTVGWSDSIESSKIGAADKGYIGHKSAKMMKRAKNVQRRQEKLIEDKESLLKDVERVEPLKIHSIPYVKKSLVELVDVAICYDERCIQEDISFVINRGDRIALTGANGCGKSSIIKLLLKQPIQYTGKLIVGSQLKVSYIPQDTSMLQGNMKDYIYEQGIDESLFKAILRKLDFKRSDFEKQLESLSGGQKKKILLATSLSEEAHIYIWDEPLNYIDILSRDQIEELILEYQPTMLFVEHDRLFVEKIATKHIELV